MLLSEAETRVQRFMDDGAAYLATIAEIDTALRVAQEEVYQLIVGSGNALFEQEASISSNGSGVVDLTTIKPLEIIDVLQSLAPNAPRLTVLPARSGDGFQFASSTVNLVIRYTARASFPASSSSPFVWGTSNVTATNIFDQLMCAIAASELKIREGETNTPLERRKAELRAAAMASLDIPGWRPMVLSSGYPRRDLSYFHYIMTAPDVMQLVI